MKNLPACGLVMMTQNAYFLTVAQNGELRAGDPVTIAAAAVQQRKIEDSENDANASLMCTACYYQFDPHTLNAAWHSAQDLPESWRCPDCGSTRESITQR